jgi:hypothetical protein
MIFVVAGNHEQAYQYINKKLEERIRNGEEVSRVDDYSYVRDVMTLKGISNPRGVFIGTWKERKDILEIVQTLMMNSINPNPVVGKIWKELKKRTALVFVNGVLQSESNDYVINDDDSISFKQAPQPLAQINIQNEFQIITHVGNGSLVRFSCVDPVRVNPRYTQSQAISDAADLLAKEIDAEVLASVCRKINGGLNGQET